MPIQRAPINRRPVYFGAMADRDVTDLARLGRYTGPATLILASLADGPKHGYALTKDIELFAAIRLPPGTLYEALARLERQGLIAAIASDDRRRPYELTATGASALQSQLADQQRVADVALRRLSERAMAA